MTLHHLKTAIYVDLIWDSRLNVSLFSANRNHLGLHVVYSSCGTKMLQFKSSTAVVYTTEKDNIHFHFQLKDHIITK